MSSACDRVRLVGFRSVLFLIRLPHLFALLLTGPLADHWSFSIANAGESAGFRSDFEVAEREGRESGLPVLIHFQAWYCGPCRQMDSQVFAFNDVQQALQSGMISVKLDVTKEPEIASRFDATTVPRDVVLYSDGRSETLNVGFLPRAGYLGLLSRIRAAALPPRPASRPDGDELAARGDTSLSKKVDLSEPGRNPAKGSHSSVAAAAGSEAIGLDGYCPVRLAKSREWVSGRPDLREEYRGIVYLFSSEEARSEFVNNPGHYAPQNLGCDPVILLSSQKAISGRIEYGAFFDDRLYLFSSQGSKDEFKKNPLKFTRIQHAIRAEEIHKTRLE